MNFFLFQQADTKSKRILSSTDQMKNEQSIKVIRVINVEFHKIMFAVLWKYSGNVLLESLKSIGLIRS